NHGHRSESYLPLEQTQACRHAGRKRCICCRRYLHRGGAAADRVVGDRVLRSLRCRVRNSTTSEQHVPARRSRGVHGLHTVPRSLMSLVRRGCFQGRTCRHEGDGGVQLFATIRGSATSGTPQCPLGRSRGCGGGSWDLGRADGRADGCAQPISRALRCCLTSRLSGPAQLRLRTSQPPVPAAQRRALRRQGNIMTVKRMDNVGIVVKDIDAAIEFFTELGLELEGRAPIEGDWADGVTGLRDMRVEIAMMRTPDGHSRLEMSRFLAPPVVADHRSAPVNALGYLRVMFTVEDIDDTLARLGKRG